MRRFMTLFAAAILGCAFLPNFTHAQIVYVGRPVARPIVVAQPVVPAYYAPPTYFAPPVTTYSAPPSAVYSYYPQTTTVYSYPPPVVTHSAPIVTYSAPIVTYSAPATVIAPAPGHYETRTYYGLGIFRPRGVYTETYYRP